MPTTPTPAWRLVPVEPEHARRQRIQAWIDKTIRTGGQPAKDLDASLRSLAQFRPHDMRW